ncbi:hypothetical protein PGH43_06395 [Legionella pneumophila 130b]|nr:hypothetical protein PGH43_06395 [Legionella pneumophila 130b]WBV67685.1 hypothetical protein PGH46_10925 [Legionella pneumophila]
MSHGGARAGAGRPRGQGKYGESTKSVRIPESRIQDVMKYLQGERSSQRFLYIPVL